MIMRNPALFLGVTLTGSVALSLAFVPTSASAQTVTLTAGANTPRDSLRAKQQRAKEDTAAFQRDSIQVARDSLFAQHRRASVIPLTPSLLATAYRDVRARDMITRARAIRLTQDSLLDSYDASTYERLSVGLGMNRFMRDRLLFRVERTSRVQWSRDAGAVIDVTGRRVATPMFDNNADVELDDQIPIPYFPGQDALWVGYGLAKANVSDRAIVNPLANGAEAYYTYTTGDSLVVQLPGRGNLVLRELRVKPRAPKWNVVVGSLWFDASSGQLVRAVYRLAEPLDVLANSAGDKDNPRAGMSFLERALIPSMTAQLSVITVEYGLFDGRFWLPRTQTAEGKATAGSFAFPVTIFQHFDYASINEHLDIKPVQINPIDTATGIAAYRARDLAYQHECDDTMAHTVHTHQWYDKTLPVLIRTPCDTLALARSHTLPPSSYASTDTLFNTHERSTLINDALGVQDEAAWKPQPIQLRYGLSYTRFNRVEGLSTAIEAQQIFGAGYTGHALFRFGLADRSPDGELGLARSNGRDTWAFNAYRRLATSNDWGDPFSLGASFVALIFGRDDGEYYRTWGSELTRQEDGGLFDHIRLFVEHQSSVQTNTNISLAHAINGLLARDNIDATPGTIAGLSLERHDAFGENPSHFRAVSDVRLQGATGSFDYVRAMADVTLNQPLPAGLNGALTLSGGMSGGDLPVQSFWYLGGPYTIRGQPIGAAAGNAYWFTRAELGSRTTTVKPILFADLGWAGDRANWTTDVQPISGVGVGASFLDGLVRFDVAKGVRPNHDVQVDTYLDTRF